MSEAEAQVEVPAPDPQAAAEPAAPARRRGTRGGSRRRAAQAAAEETAPPAAQAASEPQAKEAPEAPERAKPRRGRGRRPSRRPPAAEVSPAVEPAVPQPETPGAQPPTPVAEQPRPARELPPRRQRGRGRREGQPPGAPSAEPAPQRGGSVETLIARQNVLFEEFATQQQQTLREIQRSFQTSRRGGGPAEGGAVAPIVLPKVGVFLDVPNVIYAADDLGVKVHFGKLLDYLTQGRQLIRATAYAPVTDDPNTRFENQRFVHPVLGQGYKVVTKPWKRFADGGMKANFDIELAVDILTMSDRLDIVVLLSGDSDFKRVIELVESKGVRVEVCAFAQSTASELRAIADQYIDLGAILQYVGA